MHRRRALVAILAATASLAASIARAETRSHLEGDVRPVAAYLEEEPYRSYLNSPGAPAATFVLDAAEPELDFRAAPGTLVITGPNGSLTATAGNPTTLHGVLRRDPESGRPLLVGSAEDATCPTGAEPDCWWDGDAIPFDYEVYAAFQALRELPNIIATGPVIDPETQALFGCGPYWGTDCEVTGIDLTRMDASVLLQSWPIPGTTPVQPVVWERPIPLPGVRDPFAGGTTEFARRDFVWWDGPAPPPRVVEPITGRPLHPPGGRGSTTPVYQPPPALVEELDAGGELAPAPVLVPGLRRPPVRPAGSSQFGRRDFVFPDEMAALSWNFLMLLASMSGDGQPPFEIHEFDPSQPTTIARCSFATPQYCESVRVFFWFSAELLEDDPVAPPALRFVWEAGARYEVVEATGDFAPYAGGVAHVLGMERARANVATHGIPVLLLPAGDTLEPATPFATAPPFESESPTMGLAYLTAPEASGTGFVVPALLAALARRRRSRR